MFETDKNYKQQTKNQLDSPDEQNMTFEALVVASELLNVP